VARISGKDLVRISGTRTNKLARIVFCVWREDDASFKSLPQVA
jgi:hypothetical protein